jgi:hypothetical protein
MMTNGRLRKQLSKLLANSPGAERFEALKKAGQLRYEADKKRNDRSGPRPVHPDEEG